MRTRGVCVIRIQPLPRVHSVFYQPTTQPTVNDVLYNFRVFWQSPRSCKFYKRKVKKKHSCIGRTFSCFAAHLMEQDLF